jgi:Protein of unknown function (DUF4054)
VSCNDPLPSAITVNNFRDMLPEFSDSSIYHDETIEVWLGLATSLLDPERWGTMYGMGIALMTAHEMTLDRQAQIVAQRGGVPGFGLGTVTAKSINGVSVSYNPQISTLTNGGDWNLTIYGIRFLRFARMFGSGGVQIVGADAARVSEAALMRGTARFPNF